MQVIYQAVSLARLRQFEVGVLDLDHRAEKIFLELVSYETEKETLIERWTNQAKCIRF